MVGQLRKKFIIIAMASVTSVMILVIAAINIVNFYRFDHRVDEIIRFIHSNEGRFPQFSKNGLNAAPFDITPETEFETRFFVVTANINHDILRVNTNSIAAISEEDAVEYVEDIFNKGKTSGFVDFYKYAVFQGEEKITVVFLDCYQQLQNVHSVLYISSGVAVFSWVLVFVLILTFSKRAIKPVVESIEKQRQFITDASHEIKTPLTIISANASVLELTYGDNPWVKSIHNQTNRLSSLTKELLELSRIDEERVELKFEDFCISDTIMDAVQSFQPVVQIQSKQLDCQIQPGLLYRGNEHAVHQLVSILMDNAVKYTSDNGSILLSLYKKKKMIVLDVKNTIDYEMDTNKLNRIFDRFYRMDDSRARESGGYGIGLSIAKAIIQAHKGKIGVFFDNAKTICFTVTL